MSSSGYTQTLPMIPLECPSEWNIFFCFQTIRPSQLRNPIHVTTLEMNVLCAMSPLASLRLLSFAALGLSVLATAPIATCNDGIPQETETDFLHMLQRFSQRTWMFFKVSTSEMWTVAADFYRNTQVRYWGIEVLGCCSDDMIHRKSYSLCFMIYIDLCTLHIIHNCNYRKLCMFIVFSDHHICVLVHDNFACKPWYATACGPGWQDCFHSISL